MSNINVTILTKPNVQLTATVEGRKGKSAYELAVEAGFVGTSEEWTRSLKAEKSVEIWQPPVQSSTRIGDSANGSPVPSGNWQHPDDAINVMWEPLRLAEPDYISRETLGIDSSGLYNVYKYTFEPPVYEKTIIVSACLHGNEYSGYYTLWQFMKQVCENWTSSPQLDYMRNRVKIIIVPMINPWGFINGFRQNFNSVDLNRNSDYNWDEFSSPNLSSGTATGGTLSTLVDTSKNWTGDLTRTKVVITAGTGAGQSGYIHSHTNNTLTLFANTQFTVAPDSTSQYVILSKYYKGSSAWSEPEIQYMRDVIIANSDATVYLDLHSIITVDAHYIMYAPRFVNYPNFTIERIIKDKLLPNERIVWGTSTLPTISNFAAFNYGMMGGNPEVKNGMFNTLVRGVVESTRTLWFFGNIILQYTFLSGNNKALSIGNPYTKHISYDGMSQYSRSHSLYQTNRIDSFVPFKNDIRGFRFVDEGKKMYALCNSNKKIYEYISKEPYNSDTLQETGKYLDLTSLDELFLQDLQINPNGEYIYICGSSTRTLWQFELSTPFDLDAAELDVAFDLDNLDPIVSLPNSIAFNSDGTKLYISFIKTTSVEASSVLEFTLDTPYDISTMSYFNLFDDTLEQGSISITTGANLTSSTRIRTPYIPATAGTKYLAKADANYVIFSFHYYDASFNWLGQTGDTAPADTAFLRFAIRRVDDLDIDPSEQEQIELFLSSSANNVNKINVSAVDNLVRGIALFENADTRFLYLLGSENKTVYRYSFDKQDDLQDAVLDDMSLDVANLMTDTQSPRGIEISHDGANLYFSGSVRHIIFQYIMANGNLNTAQRYNNEAKWIPSNGNLQTCWTPFHSFNVDNNANVQVNGEVMVKSDRDMYIRLVPDLYQPFSPEFNSTRVRNNYSKLFQKKIELKANVETWLPFTALIQAQPTNLGITRRKGNVNVDGKNVTYVSGIKFDARFWLKGAKFVIGGTGSQNLNGGTTYTIDEVISPTELILNEDAGTQTNVTYGAKPYGNPRTQRVTFRLRIGAINSSLGRVFIKRFSYSINVAPTEIGFSVNLLDTPAENVISSYTELITEGESAEVAYPNPNVFVVDNYVDGDGYELVVPDEDIGLIGDDDDDDDD